MREIKFRCFDRVDKCMKRVHALDFSEWWVATNYYGGENGVCDGERNSFKNEETDRHILMQYTGLKDKNGVEIYEGDILNVVCNWDSAHMQVLWEGSQFVLKTYDAIGFKVLDVMNNIEVIGNIHEQEA